MHNKYTGNYIHFINTCYLTKGKTRSLIVDPARESFQYIPNSVYEFIKKHNDKLIDTIYNVYQNDIEVVNEYIDFLLENEYILLFKCKEELNKFAKIKNQEFDTPYIVSNAIIDIDHNSKYNLRNTILNIDKLCIPYVQFRIFTKKSKEIFYEIIHIIEDTSFIGVELIFDYSLFSKELLVEIRNHLRIYNLYIYNSPVNEIKPLHSIRKSNQIFITNNLKNEKCCGLINLATFSPTFEHYSESLLYNTCLNKKISIDINGEIKNCPAMTKSYGNIKDTSLIDVAQDMEFQKVWHIHKDQIKICKDCEFRHICTDCRAFTEDPQDQYSKPLKCGYNPYTNEWEDWSTNPLKQKAIEHYKLRDLDA